MPLARPGRRHGPGMACLFPVQRPGFEQALLGVRWTELQDESLVVPILAAETDHFPRFSIFMDPPL